MSKRLLVMVMVLAGLLAACAGKPRNRLWQHPSNVPPLGTKDFDAALLQAAGVGLKEGHQVHLVQNGTVFGETARLIREANQSIHIVLYIWRDSPPSDEILAALAERRPEVRCRVLVDTIGSALFDEDVKPRLDEIGCESRYFRPLEDDPELATFRQHRKLVVIDGRKGLTGGFGIWKSWEGDGVSSEDTWRDVNVTVEGPAAHDMQLAFAESWHQAGGELLPPEDFPTDQKGDGRARAAFVASEARTGLTRGEQLTHLSIATARKRIWISNAYFVPNDEIIRLLEMQARGGIDVRVLTSGPVHDWKFIRAAQRDTYKRLLKAGVRIFEYQPSMMHSKTALIDDRLSLIGSMNLDPFSLDRSEEGTLVIDDPKTAAEMEATFDRDVSHAKEITVDSIPGLTVFQSVSNFFLNLFQHSR